ncbi:MAG TPA: acyltransferase family protein [Pseudolysinimonas sp.]|nr:acyltransferase family protein [Pseudolysinimonas sp.]
MKAPRTLLAAARRPRAPSAAWRAAPEVATPFRVAGLDGVRAIAVTLVILFHLTPGTTIGGYLGVDLFFVVSGYLITTLLLRERTETGRIRLSAFWARRARRLLPALVVLVLVCCTAAWAIGGDVLVGLGLQVLGAATFSSNWLLLAAGSSYFGDSLPELFRNLWSLAVEEQFYLVWPLLLVLVLVRMPRPLRLILVGLLAAASAVAMAVLYTPADPNRVYYGTDAHAFGLAIGAFLALVAVSWPRRLLEWPRAARRVIGVTGPIALLALLGFAGLMPGDAPFVFRGGLVIVAVLTAVVIATLLVPSTPLARLLDLSVLRWVGARSYGLYLWHWPVFVLVVSALPSWQRSGAPGWALGGIALAISVVAAALSYRFVEQPIRRLGFGGAWRSIRSAWRVPAIRGRLARLGATAAAVVLVLAAATGTAAALVSDPGVGETQAVVEAGQQAIRDASSSPAPGSRTGASPTASPTAAPEPAGDQITAIGDSVMLAAAPTLEAQLPGVSIDAVVSRHLGTAPGILQADLNAGSLRKIVVIGLATNGPIDRSMLEQLRAQIGPQRELVLINAQAPRNWIDPNNAILTAFAQSYRNVELANWHDAAQSILPLLARDQIHFGSSGAKVFAGTIEDALKRLADLPPLRDERSNLSLPVPF